MDSSGSHQSSSGNDDDFESLLRHPPAIPPSLYSFSDIPALPPPEPPPQQQQTAAAPAPAPRSSRKRTRASRRAPTTVLTTDTTNFRAMVQEFTGIPSPPFAAGGAAPPPAVRARYDYLLPSPLLRSGAGDAIPPYLLRPFAQRTPPPPVQTTSTRVASSSASPAPAGGDHRSFQMPAAPRQPYPPLQETSFMPFQTLLSSQLFSSSGGVLEFTSLPPATTSSMGDNDFIFHGDELAGILSAGPPPPAIPNAGEYGPTTTATTAAAETAETWLE